MSSWLTSTNAKEIGTLYLIFAVFAGKLIMLALNLVICWEYLITKIPLSKKGNNFYLNSLAAVNLVLRDFTQDSLKLFNSLKSLFLCKYYIYNNKSSFFLNSILYFLIGIMEQKDKILFVASESITNIVFNKDIEEKTLNLLNLESNKNLNYTNNLNTNAKNNSQLGYYLAGLIESDGSIYIPSMNSVNTPTISIVFNIKDKNLTTHLISTLGYGSIQKSESESAINLVIRNKLGIIDIILLINGKFRTPKISRLHNLINWLNNTPTYNSIIKGKLEKLPIDISVLNNNAWLSGFSEGDSSFQIRFTEGIKYNHVSTTYEISQGRLNLEILENYKKIMQDIANLFVGILSTVYLSTYDRSGKQKFYRARNTSISGANEVVKYFTNYPLFSSKHLDFLNWTEAHNLIVNKAHHKKFGLNGLNRIKFLKNNMNNNRSDFTWSHLINFYTK